MISKRKDEHLHLALKSRSSDNPFDALVLFHSSLPEYNYDELDLSTTYLGKKFSLPFYINAMTGGSQKAKHINEKLSLIAKKYQIPLFLGSQSAALKDKELIDTYKVARSLNKEGFIVGNVNPNATISDANKAIDMIEANALAIHLNVIQEIAMREGDRDFSHWKKNLLNLINNVEVPLVIKEVGFGMSKDTVVNLSQLGFKTIDISGKGGTNFAKIETIRSGKTQSIFDNLGITTLTSLLDIQPLTKEVEILASGGVNSALDIFKCLVLGAKAVGMAGYFLDLCRLDEEEMFLEIDKLIDDLKKLMLIFNVKSLDDITNVRFELR